MNLKSHPFLYILKNIYYMGWQMKKAKLFQNGQSQAVRLPKEFRFEGKEVYIKKVGDVTMLIPIEHGWDALIESLNEFSDDFMEKRDQPKLQKREDIF